MVAYSFHKIFADQVADGTKCQTVRGDRRRHARPGEPVQLYTGLRTKAVRKLVDPDPICTTIMPIRIFVPEPVEDGLAPICPSDAVRIEIAGFGLNGAAMRDFARADGFGNLTVRCGDGVTRGTSWGLPDTARVDVLSLFAAWWWQDHGAGWWSGVVISWRAA